MLFRTPFSSITEPAPAGLRPEQGLAILYENDAWLGPLLDRLDARGVPHVALSMDDAAVLVDRPPAHPLFFNRVSPSSYLRDHGPAIPFAHALLDVLRAHGRRVVNGAAAFHVETSKVAQLGLFRRLGLSAPRTIFFNRRDQVRDTARAMRFPAFLKPDCGGSGAFVRRVRDERELALALEDDAFFAPEHLMLLQEELVSRDGSIVRIEFVDGDVVAAMRVRATNTFNLCPAESCERPPADESEPAPRVEFESYPDVPPSTIALSRELVRAAELDVGGVELVETAHGPVFFDVNATSVYRDEVCAEFGADGFDVLVDFLERELAKELAKRAAGARAAREAV